MQGYAKQRSYIFVYTWPSINGGGLSALLDVVVNAREFSIPYRAIMFCDALHSKIRLVTSWATR